MVYLKARCDVTVVLAGENKTLLPLLQKHFEKFPEWEIAPVESVVDEKVDDDIAFLPAGTIATTFQMSRTISLEFSDWESDSKYGSEEYELEKAVDAKGYNSGISAQIWKATMIFVEPKIEWRILRADREPDMSFSGDRALYHAIAPSPLFLLADAAEEE